MAKKKSRPTPSTAAMTTNHAEEKKDDGDGGFRVSTSNGNNANEQHKGKGKDKANTNCYGSSGGKANDHTQTAVQDSNGTSASVAGISSPAAVAKAKIEASPDKDMSDRSQLPNSSLSPSSSGSSSPSFLSSSVRFLLLDLPLVIIFTAYVGMVLVHQFHDDYWSPHIDLMRFIPDNRQFADSTYYHRVCTADDVTANSVDDLLVPLNATKDQAVNHMLKHGVSMYQNVLSTSTTETLREFILEENLKQEGFLVIENENRYSWGIDINMHPKIQTVFEEIAANKQLLGALQAIVGPDPAIIEFTAITSTYGAKQQFDHQDVVPPGSAAKFARTFIPSYSLFMPLQDTTAQMGATHVCPGTHLCSQGCEDFCPRSGLTVSGDGVWPQGWGALVNQQTTHKGMAHYDPYGDARVVLVATFAPRPQTARMGVETRMIAQGGSYSLRWNMWGHTLNDYVHADTRMREPMKTLRSLGIVRGNGWTYPSCVSMRIANEDTDFSEEDLDMFLDKGGLKFLPKSWQGSDRTADWREFVFQTVEATERGVREIYLMALGVYVAALLIMEAIRRVLKRPSRGAVVRSLVRAALLHIVIVAAAVYSMKVVNDSKWARSIRNGRASRIGFTNALSDGVTPRTLPMREDILISPYYDSDFLASYGNVLEVSHPGNAAWREEVARYGTGYNQLPPALQRHVVSTLDGVTQRIGRVLRPDGWRQWMEFGESERKRLFHRELIMASDPYRKMMLKQLDSFRSDMMMSPWHDMAIHFQTMRDYVDFVWERRFLPELKESAAQKPGRILHAPSGLANLPPKTNVNLRTPSTLFQEIDKAPSAGLPLTVGELVEGMYQCKYNEWYRGHITRVYANEYMVDITYEDGEEDPGLRWFCMRPFVPYVIGEEADLRLTEDDWVSGMVIQVYDEGNSYDFLSEDDELYKGVVPSKMRRSYVNYAVGTRVMANFANEGEYFPATITAVHSYDGTFDLAYDDGDVEFQVPVGRFRLE